MNTFLVLWRMSDQKRQNFMAIRHDYWWAKVVIVLWILTFILNKLNICKCENLCYRKRRFLVTRQTIIKLSTSNHWFVIAENANYNTIIISLMCIHQVRKRKHSLQFLFLTILSIKFISKWTAKMYLRGRLIDH